jgi:hypothetical protein
VIRSSTRPIPAAAISPNSARCALRAFDVIVRCVTSSARPVVRRRTRFHPDHASRQSGEDSLDLRPPQLALKHHGTVRIHAVRLEETLPHIQSNPDNLHSGRLLSLSGCTNNHSGTSMPYEQGPSTPSSRARCSATLV